jgi:flagellar operon protein
MIINNRNITSVNRIKNTQVPEINKRPVTQSGDFAGILHQQVSGRIGLKFSRHAEMRLQSRNIRLSANQLERIGEAVQKAEEKGVRDSLVMIDDIAFVVNVKNRTVVTAVNRNELKDNVFTNIDGAVFT